VSAVSGTPEVGEDGSNWVRGVAEWLGVRIIGWLLAEGLKWLEETGGTLGHNTNSFIQRAVWNYFTGKGFSAEQVAGIMGNARQESSWNPLRRSSGSQFWGLFQLNSTLSQNLHNAYRDAGLDMTKYGYSVSTYWGVGAQNNIPINDLAKILSVQLDFVYGCRPTGSDWITRLLAATSAEEAAEIFLIFFEGAINNSNNPRAGDKILFYQPNTVRHYQEADKRRTAAKEYYNQFK